MTAPLTAPPARSADPVPFRAARDSALIAERNLRVLRKNPGRMIFPLIQPVVLLVMTVSVFGNLALSEPRLQQTHLQAVPVACNQPPLPSVFMVTGRTTGKGGDAVERDEFAGFYAASFQRLVGQLYAMIGDQSEAQDAVQEAFVR